jgi:hypothetical protein
VAARDNANTASAGSSAAEQATADAIAAAEAIGKGRPTPTRKEREAARKRPLVPNDRKQAAKEHREKMNAARERARIGMANGEEKYLPQRDRGPQKRWVRDYVDARISIGEFLIPVMFVVIILTFIPSIEAQTISILALWAFFLVAVLDSTLLGFIVHRKLVKKHGVDKVEKVRWYAAMRSLQLRALRLPKPQVKRGQFPD